MRFIVDNALSWRLAERLRDAGHEAVHVREMAMADAPDGDIFLHSIGDNCIIVTQDTDFGWLMARADPPRGCVVLFRLSNGRVDYQWTRLQVLLQRYPAELLPGTIAVISDTDIRIRRF